MAPEWRRFRQSRLILSCPDGQCSGRGIARDFCSDSGSSIGLQRRATAREMYSKGVERDATSWLAVSGVVHPCGGAGFGGAGLCEEQRLQSIVSAEAGRIV